MPLRDHELMYTCLGPEITAIKSCSAVKLRRIVGKQKNAGATALTINTEMLTTSEVIWGVNIFQQMEMTICLENIASDVLQATLPKLKNNYFLIKCSLGQGYDESILSQAAEHRAGVIVPLVDGRGKMLLDCRERCKIAHKIVPVLLELGFNIENIYLDLHVTSLCTNSSVGKELFRAVRMLKKEFIGIRLLADVTPISFGLPDKALINQLFLSQLMLLGVDAFKYDPVLDNDDNGLCTSYYAARMLLGFDSFCRDYILMYRNSQRMYEKELKEE